MRIRECNGGEIVGAKIRKRVASGEWRTAACQFSILHSHAPRPLAIRHSPFATKKKVNSLFFYKTQTLIIHLYLINSL